MSEEGKAPRAPDIEFRVAAFFGNSIAKRTGMNEPRPLPQRAEAFEPAVQNPDLPTLCCCATSNSVRPVSERPAQSANASVRRIHILRRYT
jgi:hypothetical protein